MFPGLHCSPGSSPSSLWPAAEHFFVRPHQPGGWPFALALLAGLHAAAAAHVPRRSFRCVRRCGFRLAGSLVQSAASLIRRVRPNQALQRTGSVCGFTLLSLFQARRQFGRPLNTSSLGRTNRAVGGSLSRCSWGVTRRPVLGVLAARLAAVGVAASSSPVLSCSQHLCQPAACGLTRRCSGPAVCAGLHCSPGSSPSSVWPAAEHSFVRPHLSASEGPPHRGLGNSSAKSPFASLPRIDAIHRPRSFFSSTPSPVVLVQCSALDDRGRMSTPTLGSDR